MKPGRNDPCPCGSGKKYKHCCQDKAQARASAPKPGAAELDQLALLFHARRYAELEMRARLLVERYPDSGEAWNSLGVARKEQGKDALPALRIAAELIPGDATVHNNLGNALRDAWHLDEAVESYLKALALNPDYARASINLGGAYARQGKRDKAKACIDGVLAANPDDAIAHFERATLLLLRGDFEHGWKEYEYGLACGERQPRFQNLPRWRGEPLAGKTLLVCAEQGLGDEIMFASIFPEIIEQAGHCIIECDPKLVPIFGRSFPSATIIRRRFRGETGFEESLPHVDFQIPSGSLPLNRRNRLEDFPRHSGYLKPDQKRVDYWKARVEELGPGLKLGISWRGGVPNTGNYLRSVPLPEWQPLFGLKGVHFISLQYTQCREELDQLEREHGIRVTHWQDAIDDYDETAALVCALDLVVSVQTAVAHLSGALGRTVWVMVPFHAEWRYQSSGETSPWYPSARLFRQAERGQWRPVIERVGKALSELILPISDESNA